MQSTATRVCHAEFLNTTDSDSDSTIAARYKAQNVANPKAGDGTIPALFDPGSIGDQDNTDANVTWDNEPYRCGLTSCRRYQGTTRVLHPHLHGHFGYTAACVAAMIGQCDQQAGPSFQS